MFKKILIANRGEIALRIIRASRELGIKTVAVFSTADDLSLHKKFADEAICIGPPNPLKSYLNIPSILAAAELTDADAIHPGYGFLSENPSFSKMVKKNNIIFIGPSESSMKSMAYKNEARKLMEDAGVSVLPGFPVENMSNNKIVNKCNDIGYPLIIKASAGGGGKGMHVIRAADEIIQKLEQAKREALSSFGDDKVLIEKYLESPRHIEVQIVADNFGNIQALSDRDCSIQRRHQKVVEEAPAPFIKQNIKDNMAKQAIEVAKKIAYSGAGTIEFLYENNEFYFMEMNTRLQVEHPVTEEILGIDLVEVQIRVACNEKLENIIKKIKINGHALEVRVYAENPENDFLPSPGKIKKFEVPKEDYIRLDTGYEDYDEVSPYYDPMIAKIITYGKDRNDAIRKMSLTLGKTKLFGLDNNVYFLNNIIINKYFSKKDINTQFIDKFWTELVTPAKLKEDFRILFASLFIYLRNNENSSSFYSPWSNKENWRHVNNDKEEVLFIDNKDEFNFKCQIISENEYIIFSSLEEIQLAEIKYLTNENNSIFKVLFNNKPFEFEVFEDNNEYYFSSMGYSFKYVSKEKYANILSEDSVAGSFDAPVPGKVAKIFTKVNQKVKKGYIVAVIEAMKMEHSITAPYNGKIKKINVKENQQVDEGFTLIEMEKENE